MKSHQSRRWTPLLIALALVASCSDGTGPDAEEGQFLGRWDGKLWLGDASAFLATGTPQGDILHVFGTSPRGADAWSTKETLSARVVFRGPGIYPLQAGDVSFFEIVGGDVISAQYNGAGSPAGYLRIRRYDGPGGIIEGELEFSAATNSAHASYGATARLEDGEFRAVVTAQAGNVRAP